jgi:hypothetical protein
MTLIINPARNGDLIRSDSKGGVLVPAEQREALLDAYERSGQSGVAFCQQHGLKYPTFATWVQKRRRLSPPEEASSEPIRVPGFAEVMLEAPAPGPPFAPASGNLAITLPDGTRIDIACRSQLSWAAELLRHLSSSRPC